LPRKADAVSQACCAAPKFDLIPLAAPVVILEVHQELMAGLGRGGTSSRMPVLYRANFPSAASNRFFFSGFIFDSVHERGHHYVLSRFCL
jgi:hypothetical protein